MTAPGNSRDARGGLGTYVLIGVAIAALLAVIGQVALPAARSLGSGSEEDEVDFCWYSEHTRTLELRAEPTDEVLAALPLVVGALTDEVPPSLRADAQTIEEAAAEALETDSVEPLLTEDVQLAVEHITAEAESQCER